MVAGRFKVWMLLCFCRVSAHHTRSAHYSSSTLPARSMPQDLASMAGPGKAAQEQPCHCKPLETALHGELPGSCMHWPGSSRPLANLWWLCGPPHRMTSGAGTSSCAGWSPYAVASAEIPAYRNCLALAQVLTLQLCPAWVFVATGESLQVLVGVCQQAEEAAGGVGTHFGKEATAAGRQGL